MRILFLLLVLPAVVFSQPTRQPDAAQIRLKLHKLNFLGSVLYMAAHPDDENTNVIAHLSNHRLAATAYLSLTRGDGGQNLIGPEIRELLGLIRTQELLAARRIDGGQQFFTRAIDFGFSKSADEAFAIWGKDAVLSDAVKVFRMYQPDVVITRFPPDERAGHGHHTASAIVAGEAFDRAADPGIFPEQVAKFGTWQPKRLLTNTGRWWNRTINEHTAGIITLDVGGYNALLGKSYSEISALSSSQHKSQGWGRAGQRGYMPEFLEPVKGVKAVKDIFEGIDTTWHRAGGQATVAPLVKQAIASFDAGAPARVVPLLFRIRNEISKLNPGVWKDRKLKETEQLIVDCLGFFVEVTADHFLAAPGEEVKARVEILNRSSVPLVLEGVRGRGFSRDSIFSAVLAENKPLNIQLTVPVPAEAPYTDPYWLQAPPGDGLYEVADVAQIGLPERDPVLNVALEISVEGEKLTVHRPVIYKWVDPVKGELWRPFEIVPPVTLSLSERVLIFPTAEPRPVTLVLKSSSKKALSGTVMLDLPSGWKSTPASFDFELSGRGAEQTRTVTVSPAPGAGQGMLRAVAEVSGRKYDQSLQVIAYDHFPVQTLLPPAQTRLVRLDLKKAGNTIGYIKGAGDDIPAALRNMGYQVWEMNNEEITAANLRRVDAVVLGIRALNTNERARFFMPVLMEYVKGGGTVVVQYNTNARLETDQFAPFPLSVGRDRVTDEGAEVRILKPNHPVLNTPNKITPADFDGWVQERGLYFPNEWDGAYDAVISINDKGQAPQDGSLLVAKYGAGYYVYTGLAFFRELPEGVQGAYKLFANLVSLGGVNTGAVKTERKNKTRQ